MKVHYVTWLKNRIGVDYDLINVDEKNTISDILDMLEVRGEKHKNTLQNRNVIYAELNGSVVSHNTVINNQEELYLFGPIVGG